MGGEGGAFLAIIDGKVVGFAALDYNTFEPDTVVLGVWMLPGDAPPRHRHGARGVRARLRARQGLQAHPRPPAAGQRDALAFLSSIGALVPIYNPEARFELPLV